MDRTLLDRYFRGLCNEAEQARVEAWLNEAGDEAVDAYFLAHWQEQAPAPVGKVRRMRWWPAAAAAILAGVAALGLYRQQSQPAQTMATRVDTLRNNGTGVKLVSMPDGTKVWLNAHAYITYDAAYNTGSRQLALSGEAYFEVAVNEKAPFSVKAGGIVTTALGTSFNIAAPTAADQRVMVSLITGKAAVSAADSSIAFRRVILLPGDRITVSGNMQYKQSACNQRETMDWKEGKVVFDNSRLDDAFAKLQRRYGQIMVLRNPALAGKRLTASFPGQVPLDVILNKLAFVQGLTYERRADTIFVSGR